MQTEFDVSSTKSVLLDNDTVEQVFRTLEIETAALFEHLDLSCLMDHPVFALSDRGANTGSRATRTAERCLSLLLPRYLRSSSDGARTPQQGRLGQCGFENPPG